MADAAAMFAEMQRWLVERKAKCDDAGTADTVSAVYGDVLDKLDEIVRGSIARPAAIPDDRISYLRYDTPVEQRLVQNDELPPITANLLTAARREGARIEFDARSTRHYDAAGELTWEWLNTPIVRPALTDAAEPDLRDVAPLRRDLVEDLARDGDGADHLPPREVLRRLDALPGPADDTAAPTEQEGGAMPLQGKRLSGWNYRVVRLTHQGETLYGIHEAYYEPLGWTAAPVAPVAESVAELRDVLARMAVAPELEVIDGGEVEADDTAAPDAAPRADWSGAWAQLTGYVRAATEPIDPALIDAYMVELKREALRPFREWVEQAGAGQPVRDSQDGGA